MHLDHNKGRKREGEEEEGGLLGDFLRPSEVLQRHYTAAFVSQASYVPGFRPCSPHVRQQRYFFGKT
jgi:hypothetical protein